MKAWRLVERAARKFLSKKPFLFSFIYRWVPKYRERIVGQPADGVIEGYSRSANTCAAIAFAYAQNNQTLKIARHQHSVAQILYAVGLGIPCIVLIRKPEDVVASYLIRDASMRVGEALAQHVKFYHPLLDSILTARFEGVAQNYNVIIRKLNKMFGCSCPEFLDNSKSQKEIFELVEKMGLSGSKETKVRPSREASLNRERRKLSFKFKDKILEPEYAQLLGQAHKIHQQILAANRVAL